MERGPGSHQAVPLAIVFTLPHSAFISACDQPSPTWFCLDNQFKNPNPSVIQSSFHPPFQPYSSIDTPINLPLNESTPCPFPQTFHSTIPFHGQNPSSQSFHLSIHPSTRLAFIHAFHSSILYLSHLSFPLYQPINRPIFFYTSHSRTHPYSLYNSPFICTSLPNTLRSHLDIHPSHPPTLPSPTLYHSAIQSSIHHSSIPTQPFTSCISSSQLIAWTWLCLWK